MSRVDRPGAGWVPAGSGKSSRIPAAGHIVAHRKHVGKCGLDWRVMCGETGRGWAVGLQPGWQGPLGTEPTSLCGLSWQKSWSWSCRANSGWRVNGGRLRAIGRPRSLTSLAGGCCGAGWDWAWLRTQTVTYSPFPFRVNDEKVSRGYLQALATKMAEELESLRNVGTQTLPTRPLVSPMHKSRGVCVYV